MAHALAQTHYDTKHVIYLQNAGCNISLAPGTRLIRPAVGAALCGSLALWLVGPDWCAR